MALLPSAPMLAFVVNFTRTSTIAQFHHCAFIPCEPISLGTSGIFLTQFSACAPVSARR